MVRFLWSGIAVAGVLATAPAYAQDAAPATTTETPAAEPKAAPPPASSETVVVTGQRPANRIDREVYDPKNDPDTPTSSVADALNKAPGVNVDPEGNVSLRGNSNVQVLIDGKPTSLLQGESRASTLQSLSASDLESVEVMANPSAQFSADGGGGIINLVMRRNRRPGKTLGINLGVGNEGRVNGNVSFGMTKARTTVQTGLFGRHDVSDSDSFSVRERTGSTGVTNSRTNGVGEVVRDVAGVNFGLDYVLSDKDTVGAQAQFFQFDMDRESTSDVLESDASGVPSRAYTSRTDQGVERRATQLRFNLTHEGDQEGEELKAGLRYSQSQDDNDNRTVQLYSIGGTSVGSRQLRENKTDDVSVDLDYERAFGQRLLTTGLKLGVEQYRADFSYYDVDLASGIGTLNASRSNVFEVDEVQTEGYVTFQAPLGEKWTVMPGLRLELTDLDMRQVTSNIERDRSYLTVHPSFHATYAMSDIVKVRLAYSNRVRRPGANELNPFIVITDDRNASSGNPELDPQTTHSFEAGYERSKGGRSLTLRAFYRKDVDAFTERTTFLSETQLLTTRANGGEGSQTGAEIALNGRLGKKLNIDLRSTVSYNELESESASGALQYDGTSVNGRAMLNYRATPKDQLQLMLNGFGKQLTGEGYNEPVYTADFSYRRKINNKVSISASVRDLFDSADRTRIIDTPTLREETTTRGAGRVFTIGLTLTPLAKDGSAQEQSPGMGGPPPGVRPGGGGPGGYGGGRPPF